MSKPEDPNTLTTLEKLPTGAAREALREKGQFFTPGWVADAMVAFAGKEAKALYDYVLSKDDR